MRNMTQVFSLPDAFFFDEQTGIFLQLASRTFSALQTRSSSY